MELESAVRPGTGHRAQYSRICAFGGAGRCRLSDLGYDLYRRLVCRLLPLSPGLCSAEGVARARKPMSLVIKGGTVVTAERSFKADVYCEAGMIKAVGDVTNAPEGAEIIDASGQ